MDMEKKYVDNELGQQAGSYLLLFRKRQWKSFEILYSIHDSSYFEISVSLF